MNFGLTRAMTWSYHRAFSEPNWADRWTAVFQELDGRGNIVSNQGGWNYYDPQQNDYRILAFRFVDTDSVARYHQVSFKTNSTTWYGGRTFTTNGDPWPYEFLGGIQMNGAYATTSYDWKMWISDEDASAWMLTANGSIIGMWPPAISRTVPKYQSADVESGPSGYVAYGQLYPSFRGGYYCNMGGFPNEPLNGTTSYIRYPFDSSDWIPTGSSLLFKELPISGPSSNFGVMADDVLFHIPVGVTMDGVGLNSSTSVPSSIAFSNGKYYIVATGNTTSVTSFFFDCGAVDPTNDLFN